MFREMRRKKQQLSMEETRAILDRGTSGVLAVAGDGDYPYAVPLSYVYDGEKLYFHCARQGHKLDALARNPRASFCVVQMDQVVPEKYTTCYQSAIVFGTVRVLEDEGEKRAAIEKLAVKYAPDDQPENREREIRREWAALCMLAMTPEHITGKEAIELTRQRGERG